jgi:hypothetical protein
VGEVIFDKFIMVIECEMIKISSFWYNNAELFKLIMMIITIIFSGCILSI